MMVKLDMKSKEQALQNLKENNNVEMKMIYK